MCPASPARSATPSRLLEHHNNLLFNCLKDTMYFEPETSIIMEESLLIFYKPCLLTYMEPTRVAGQHFFSKKARVVGQHFLNFFFKWLRWVGG